MPLKTSSQLLVNTLVILLTNWNQLNILLLLISWMLSKKSRRFSRKLRLRLNLVRWKTMLLTSLKNWRLSSMPRLRLLNHWWKLLLRKLRQPLRKSRPRLRLVLNKERVSWLNFCKRSWKSWLNWRMNWLDTISLATFWMMSSSPPLSMPLKTSSPLLPNTLVILLTNWNQLNSLLLPISWMLSKKSRRFSRKSRTRLNLVRWKIMLLTSLKNWRLSLMPRLRLLNLW